MSCSFPVPCSRNLGSMSANIVYCVNAPNLLYFKPRLWMWFPTVVAPVYEPGFWYLLTIRFPEISFFSFVVVSVVCSSTCHCVRIYCVLSISRRWNKFKKIKTSDPQQTVFYCDLCLSLIMMPSKIIRVLLFYHSRNRPTGQKTAYPHRISCSEYRWRMQSSRKL